MLSTETGEAPDNDYDEVLPFRIKLIPCELLPVEEEQQSPGGFTGFLSRLGSCGLPKLNCQSPKAKKSSPRSDLIEFERFDTNNK